MSDLQDRDEQRCSSEQRISRREVLGRSGTLIGAATLLGLGGLAPGSAAAAQITSGAGRRLRIVFINNAPASEPFAGIVANGLAQAGKDFNLTAIYRGTQTANPADATEQIRLIKNAIATKPDGIITSNVFPKQMNPVIKSAVGRGIPVILQGFGLEDVVKTGAMTFIGGDWRAVGVVNAERLNQLRAKHLLLITVPPGIAPVDAQVEGIRARFAGKITALEVPLGILGNQVQVRNTIQAAIVKNSSVDSACAIGIAFTPGMVSAREGLGARGKKIKWIQAGLDRPTLTAIKTGRFDSTVDIQQYLIGYIAGMWMALHVRFGFEPAQTFISTGASRVLRKDAARLERLSVARIRG